MFYEIKIILRILGWKGAYQWMNEGILNEGIEVLEDVLDLPKEGNEASNSISINSIQNIFAPYKKKAAGFPLLEANRLLTALCNL